MSDAVKDLSREKRERLEEKAGELGIEHPADNDKFPNKGVLAEAIVEAGGTPDDASGPSWGQPGYDGPQPWESDDDQEPVTGCPILVSGSAGADVMRLCRLLADCGYETPVSRGENALAVLGGGELAAVQAFRREYGVREDPSAFKGGENQASLVVGPWTWTALAA